MLTLITAIVLSSASPSASAEALTTPACAAYVYADTRTDLCADFPGSTDRDCAQIKRPVTLIVKANDPWRLDRDGNGQGCETDVVTTPPTKPSTSVSASPKPSASTSSSASTKPSASTSNSVNVSASGPSLPVTGPGVGAITAAGGVALLAGGGLLLLARRRRARFEV